MRRRRPARQVRVLVSAAFVFLVLLAAVMPRLFTARDPLLMHPDVPFAPPGRGYLLGTDEFGRDLLARIAYGARPSLEVAAGSVAVAGAVGSVIGVLGGYGVPVWEALAMRSADVILCFPPILLAMMIAGFLGAGVGHLILIIGFLYIPQFSRLAFAQTLAVRRSEYVEAARAVGAPTVRVLARAIFPDLAGAVVGLGDRDGPQLHVPDAVLCPVAVARAERDDPQHQHHGRRSLGLPRSPPAPGGVGRHRPQRRPATPMPAAPR